MPAERGTSTSGLLERDAELAALDALVAVAVEGDGRLALIQGPAGIGKSGLLADLRRSAQPRLQALAARASELEPDRPGHRLAELAGLTPRRPWSGESIR